MGRRGRTVALAGAGSVAAAAAATAATILSAGADHAAVAMLRFAEPSSRLCVRGWLREPGRGLRRGLGNSRRLAQESSRPVEAEPEGSGTEIFADDSSVAAASGAALAVESGRRQALLGKLPVGALFALYATFFVPQVRRTDPYRWLFAQLEGLDAYADPESTDLGMLKRAAGLLGVGGTDPSVPLRILDLGAGTGGDLRYLTSADLGRRLEVLAVDPNVFAWTSAREQAKRLGLASDSGDGAGSAGTLEFFQDVKEVPSESVSLVFAHHVFCSVEDPEGIIREVHRCLRPGGAFVFVEHVAAGPGSFLRTFQQLYRPVQQAFAGGCDPSRDTAVTIRLACKWSSLEVEPYIIEGFGPIAPHVRGVAVK